MTTRLLACGIALLLAAAPGCGGSSDHADDKHADAHPDEHGEGGRAHADEHDGEDEHAHGNDHDGEDGHAHEADPGEVHVTAEQRQRFAVTVAEAGPGEIDLGVDLPGEVHPDGNRVAHIVPRFPGIVKEVRRNIGDAVKSGDVLAVVESSESLAPYPLTTALDGTVIEKHLTRGEAIDRDKQAFVVADLSTVWVDASVFQKNLSRIHVGDRVLVFADDAAAAAEGTISYITPVVDAPTRTATARVVLPNTGGRWRPGMFVTVRALEAVQVPVAIDRRAVQTIDGKSVVFVETDHGFAIRPVVLGRGGPTRVEVLSGLAPGERYAVGNTFLLKAEAGRGTAEHEH